MQSEKKKLEYRIKWHNVIALQSQRTSRIKVHKKMTDNSGAETVPELAGFYIYIFCPMGEGIRRNDWNVKSV